MRKYRAQDNVMVCALQKASDLYFSWARCQTVRGRCIVLLVVEDKVGDKTKHAIISIQQPRSSNTELNIATRALWDHNMHNI